jgi:GH25 family lysozyme M1 (1,4-beta-N-acetylmuramidase)
MGIYGQDWASYQSAAPDTSGLSFVFIKVTEGLSYTNPLWQRQRDHACSAGLVVGYYHYPHMANSAQQEADHFLAVAQPGPGELVVLDWEGYDSANSAVPKAQQAAYKEAFLRRLKASAPHQPVGLYANIDYWRNVDTTSFFQDFLWIATAGRAAGDPGIQASWLFHQFTDSPVDTDYCHLGSTAELRSWAMSFMPPLPPAPTPAPAPVPAPVPSGRRRLDEEVR